MSHIQKIFIAFLVLLWLLIGLSAPAMGLGDNSETGENTVYTEKELEVWCQNHSKTGGTVFLGCNITISDGIGIYNNENSPITIDTGEFGLFFDGAGASISGSSYNITGQGVKTPVVTLKNINSVPFYMSNWNAQIFERTIIAVGDSSGAGGVALNVLRGDDKAFNAFSLGDSIGLIRSSGTGAIGLLLGEAMDVYCLNIQVDGEGSVAVDAPTDTNLYYCRLSAKGADAVCMTEGVILDSCLAKPEPQNGGVINRQILSVSGQWLYVPVRQDSYFIPWSLPSILTCLMSGDDVFPPTIAPLSVEWDWDDIDAVDTAKPGFYDINGALAVAFSGLGLEKDFPLVLLVEVRDTALPCIWQVYFVKPTDRPAYAELYFWDRYDPDADGVILWRSDDEGESWYSAGGGEDIVWDGNKVYYYFGDLTHPVMFCLEMPDIGFSNIVTIYRTDGASFGATGGDRTGVDRLIGRKKTVDDDPPVPDDEDPLKPLGSPVYSPSHRTPSAQNQIDTVREESADIANAATLLGSEQPDNLDTVMTIGAENSENNADMSGSLTANVNSGPDMVVPVLSVGAGSTVSVSSHRKNAAEVIEVASQGSPISANGAHPVENEQSELSDNQSAPGDVAIPDDTALESNNQPAPAAQPFVPEPIKPEPIKPEPLQPEPPLSIGTGLALAACAAILLTGAFIGIKLRMKSR